MNRKTNIFLSKLSNKQRHTLDYWRVATQEIENTCLSVLNLMYQNDDYANYLRYQQQFQNFKEIRNVLSNIVLKTVETNNLLFMESVVVNSVKQLMNTIVLNSAGNEGTIRKTTAISRMYNEIALIIVKCMLILKKKIQDVDQYLNKIPTRQIKYETEAYKTLRMLDAFANRLNFMLRKTLKGRNEQNGQIAESVFQSVELIITSVQRISFDKRSLCKIEPPVSSSTSYIPNSIPTENRDKFIQRTRNVWSLVQEEKSARISDTLPDTPRFIENILNDNSLRYRDKLKIIRERMKGSTNMRHSHDDDIPYGWIHPTEEQIEDYICRNGGCPTSTLQAINAKERFTLTEIVKMFPCSTQHLRFPPNPSNASIFTSKAQNQSEISIIDEDLLEGLLWRWHEVSDSESTISVRFQFEMSDTHRRERWLRGFRRVLEVDPDKMIELQREILVAQQSRSYTELRDPCNNPSK
ncbi:uncharacterized protein LOC119072443 isoform X2 [Bradysia coprophila]|uniref:uncharacterized protein LOC119072443 isoform X2 n=1 Tax=Bradysia coprophila TaxID=38358 RepID=UPI00187D99BD|nr:uncharacterized protein LOC119072443 isoform X2 [Bradysia coprophila]